MTGDDGCSCDRPLPLVFACSGAADVGALADKAARRLSAEGIGAMFCLAGIGGRVSGIMKTTEAASAIVALDGCGSDCAKRSLENAGFTGFNHIRLTDLGMKKGQTGLSDENLSKVMDAARKKMASGR